MNGGSCELSLLSGLTNRIKATELEGGVIWGHDVHFDIPRDDEGVG